MTFGHPQNNLLSLNRIYYRSYRLFIVQPDLQSGCFLIFRQIANLPVRKGCKSAGTNGLSSFQLLQQRSHAYLAVDYGMKILDFHPFLLHCIAMPYRDTMIIQ